MCVSKLIIIGSDNGRRQAIICSNVGILLIGPLVKNFNEILIEIHTFLIQEKAFEYYMPAGKWRPFCLGPSLLTLNVRGPSYLGSTRSISWLLMPWLLTSPRHQQPWYLRTCVTSMWNNDIKCKYMIMFPLKNLARKGLMHGGPVKHIRLTYASLNYVITATGWGNDLQSVPGQTFTWNHDDVIKWKHFPRYWPFVRGIHGHRWIPLTKASDAELWCFLSSASE